MITFFHDYISNDHTKATLQFTSNGQAGEITFEVRYSGSAYSIIKTYIFFILL